MPPIQFWFTTSTLTLWVAIFAAATALWVSINSEWQNDIREKARIAVEQNERDARTAALDATLNIAEVATKLAYEPVEGDAGYEAWKARVQEFLNESHQRLERTITAAEVALAFSNTGTSMVFASSVNREHSDIKIRLLGIAEKLRNIALKYS